MPIEFLKPKIVYCPGCSYRFEELDCTTFYCQHCDSQWQIEYEFPDHYNSLGETKNDS